eukprot:7098664-Lingulodinium_polyedra.AAC.1
MGHPPERCRPSTARPSKRAAAWAPVDRRGLPVPGTHGGWQLAWNTRTRGPELGPVLRHPRHR